jgi:RNA polymerase sigma factor (TIGR02999 family)
VDSSRTAQTTRLLQDLAAGKPGASDQLLPVVYEELHRMAERMMRSERADHTLQPTALIHEAFLRLVDNERDEWDSRVHFMRVAARAMRFVLVDHSRARRAQKRGGNRHKVTLDEGLFAVAAEAEQLLLIDEALTRLGEVDEQLAQIVEMRFFGGMQNDEIARALAVSTRTVERGWRLARAWLLRAMGDQSDDEQ